MKTKVVNTKSNYFVFTLCTTHPIDHTVLNMLVVIIFQENIRKNNMCVLFLHVSGNVCMDGVLVSETNTNYLKYRNIDIMRFYLGWNQIN